MGCVGSRASRHVADDRVPHTRGAIPKRRFLDNATQIHTFRMPAGHAIVCAVDTYVHLTNVHCVADGKNMVKVLQRLNFNIIATLYNDECSPGNIERTLRAAASHLPDRDRLFVFMGGHGLRHKATGRCFFATKHTVPDSLLDSGYDLNRLHSLRDFLPQHILWVFDFCFSGAPTVATRGNNNLLIARHMAYPSVQFMSAGTSSQLVTEAPISMFCTTPPSSLDTTPICTPLASPNTSPENSLEATYAPRLKVHPSRMAGVFTTHFLRELRRAARAYEKYGIHTTATSIFIRVRNSVMKSSKIIGNDQLPQLVQSPFWRNKRAEGDFVF